MKAVYVAAFALAGAMVSAPALASLDVAKKNGCTACHAVDKKLVGPAYKDVVTQKDNAADKNLVATLKTKIKNGGSGKYGAIPMAPQPKVSDADLETLAKWIAGGAK